MGGIFYQHPLDQVFPEFWKEAPVERRIIDQRHWMMGSHEEQVADGGRPRAIEKVYADLWRTVD